MALKRFEHHLEIQFSHFINPFKGYEGFFGKDKINFESARKIKLPQGHELHGKIRKMRLIEFEPKENFKRQAVLIKDEQKNKSIVLVCKDNFEPTNRTDVPGHSNGLGETIIHVVYGDASTVGSIEFLQDQMDIPFEEVEKIVFEKAKKMKLGCEQSGIKFNDPDNLIQLSGMHVIVIKDPQNSDSINSKNMQEAIAFLFGSVGPFKDTIIFPEKGQAGLMNKIKMAGGRTLLNGPDPESEGEITLSQLKRLKGSLKSVERGKNINKLSREERFYLEKAFLSYIPFLIHWHKLLMSDRETFSTHKGLFRYLKGQLKSKLQTLLDSPLSNYS